MNTAKRKNKPNLASFQVDPIKWDKFKELATAEKKSASRALQDFIEQCLERGCISEDSQDSPPTSDDFKERTEQAIAALKAEMAEIKGKLAA